MRSIVPALALARYLAINMWTCVCVWYIPVNLGAGKSLVEHQSFGRSSVPVRSIVPALASARYLTIPMLTYDSYVDKRFLC